MLCVSPSLHRSEYRGFLCLVHSAEPHGDLALSGKGARRCAGPGEAEVSGSISAGAGVVVNSWVSHF